MSTFARVVPLLVYSEIPQAHDFLVNAFGFESAGVDFDRQGRAVHAEVRAGATSIWLHRVTDEHRLASPLTGAAGSGLVVFVDDVDAHHERAKAAGAAIESAPQDMPYGQREYGARDPEGHRWWFAAPLPVATSS